MMRDLLILGTGAHAAEMAGIVERINAAAPTWRMLGFVSADPVGSSGTLNGHPVLGADAITDLRDTALAVENEWPRPLSVSRERLASLVDPSVFVAPSACIGSGCVFFPHGFVGHRAQLGDEVFCLAGCILNHDVVVEDGVIMASGVVLAGSVHVEAGCYLGQFCTVRQQVRIGRGSLIGMGAVVLRDVPPNSVMVGNPARRLRDRE
jgi:sugar O-acyltransferase (sialic acid O-acetyltransferase NeuD family)